MAALPPRVALLTNKPVVADDAEARANARARSAKLRVVEKLGIRKEGVAERFLQINGVWEDHARFAMTSEEWIVRRDELLEQWIDA